MNWWLAKFNENLNYLKAGDVLPNLTYPDLT